jgi:hypothetical protein
MSDLLVSRDSLDYAVLPRGNASSGAWQADYSPEGIFTMASERAHICWDWRPVGPPNKTS